MSSSSEHLQGTRLRRLEIEDERTPNSSYHRFSSSSSESRESFEYTTITNNLQHIRSKLYTVGWELKTSWRKRVCLIVIILLVVAFVSVSPLSLTSKSHTSDSVWMSFVFILIHRLSPPIRRNGVHEIVNHWRAEDPTREIPSFRYQDFSRDIKPIPCHSHNDYMREVPLYQAIEAGCTSVEADIWLEDKELYVGHHSWTLTSSSTLKKLYIDPLVAILEHQNNKSRLHAGDESGRVFGVYDTDPDVSLVLLLDFETDGKQAWLTVQEQLEPLRERGMLTSWNGDTKAITQRPVTVVGTGYAPFDLIVANTTYRDVFFDAPLDQLSDKYTPENSFYASCSFLTAVGIFWLRPSSSQVAQVKSQIEAASRRGLISRYWDAPDWPISRRNNVWNFLLENGIGILNVNDVMNAARWNWDWCVVAGLVLC